MRTRPADIPDLGPPPQRITVSPTTARRLVTEQLPQWAHLPVIPVATSGWDNVTFRLGDELLLRLPSAAEYALAVEKEQRWLPVLAGQVTLPVPVPCAVGAPGCGYPYAWSVYRWLDGTPVAPGVTVDRAFALDLAGFVASLRAVDPTGGPRPGVHCWYRGGSLWTFDATVQECLDDLAGQVDAGLVTDVWTSALDAPWDGREAWFHGDLAGGNLLVDDGRLCAVIDFGTCGVGDPACDIAVAWTMLDDAGRRVFRERLGVDDAECLRGRGWALWKTLSSLAAAGDAAAAGRARGVLDALCAEHAAD